MKHLVSLGTLLVFFLSACSQQDYSNLKARSIWLKNQRILETAVNGGWVNDTDAMNAASFFEHVAGIHIPGDHSPVIDWFPTAETGLALKSLRQWYRVNGSRLYCDPESGKVRVKP